MTYHCKKVLKNLQKISQNSESCLCLIFDSKQICLFDDFNYSYDYSEFQNEIFGILSVLIQNGYLMPGMNECYFSLTYKGLHPYRVGWEAIKRFLFTSIFIPITVSVITSITVLWLQGLLKLP